MILGLPTQLISPCCPWRHRLNRAGGSAALPAEIETTLLLLRLLSREPKHWPTARSSFLEVAGSPCSFNRLIHSATVRASKNVQINKNPNKMWINNQQEAPGKVNSPSTDAVAGATAHTKKVEVNKEATHTYKNKRSCHSLFCSQMRCSDHDCLGQCSPQQTKSSNDSVEMVVQIW